MSVKVRVSLPLEVIKGAMNADEQALNIVLNRFSRYIDRLSTRTIIDRYGNQHSVVDDNIKIRLQTRLISSIINDFKILTE